MTQPSKKKAPPKKVPQSKQYDLFTEFLGNQAELSNTIEFWDAIPKYSVTARRQVAIRNNAGRLPVHEYVFNYASKGCRIEVQPASLKVDGQFRDYYPSANEELIEEVIRKIFADQRYGVHDAPNMESWVRFSPSMIRKELEHRGKTRSYKEIRQSIEILANTTIRLYVDDDINPIYTSTILSDLTRVNRAAYLDDPSAMWAARLPALVSKSVNDLTYRQFNYGTFMSLSSQLTRWLHKLLSHRYTGAGFTSNYEVLFSTLQRNSGLLEHARINTNTKALEKSLDELIAADVLDKWEKQERRGDKNRIDDILYTFYASREFIQQMKAANKRLGDSKTAVSSHRPLPNRST